MTIDESWMREICTSSLTRGRDIARQARYAGFRHRRGNPETRSTETYPYRCTLSTLPADGTLALERPPRGRKHNWRWPDTWYRSGLRRTWVRPRRKRKERPLWGSPGRKSFLPEKQVRKELKEPAAMVVAQFLLSFVSSANAWPTKTDAN